MKKIQILIFFLTTLIVVKSQANFTFDKNYINSENHWVAIQTEKKPTDMFFAYLYFDESGGGYSLQSMGSFTYENGKISNVRKSDDEKSSHIMRLPNYKIPFAWLSENQIKDLGVKSVPDYMKYYNTIGNENEKKVERASQMNGLGDIGNALEQLQKVHDSGFKSKKLYFELGFAQNALGNFDAAKNVIEESFANNFKDELIDKEYLYSLVHNNNLILADQFLRKNISDFKNPLYREESIVNILNSAKNLKQGAIFSYWVEIYNHEFSTGGKYKDVVKKFESDMVQK